MTRQSEKEYIEARLMQDRAALKASVSELHSRVSLGAVTRKAAEFAAVGSWRSAGLLARGAKANPFGFALISAGVAWIFLRPKQGAKPVAPVATARWEDEGGLVVEPSHSDEWSDELDTLRKQASDKLHHLEADAKAGLTNAYGKVRDYAAERAEAVNQFAADLNRTLGIGLENMSEVARAAAVSARENTYLAQIEAERLARKTSRLTQDHPVSMGMAALTIGVVLAALAPKGPSRQAKQDQSRKDHDNDLRLREAAVLLRETRLAEADSQRRRAANH